MEYKIGVIGDRQSVLSFGALGLSVFPVENGQDGRQTLHRLAKEDYAILYITEELASEMEQDIMRYKDSMTPAVILIPGARGSLGIGMAAIKTAVERAVGADIL